MILIRSTGKVEVGDLPSLPSEIRSSIESLNGWTEIGSDASVLDGSYTAQALRTIADLMDWHKENEQRPIEMITEIERCRQCSKPLTHDAFGAFCFNCAYAQAVV